MKWRSGIAAGLVLSVGLLVVLAMTSPWSAGPDPVEPSRVERALDPLEVSRKLVGGKARFIGCRDSGRKRVCRVEGPTGKQAICFLFKAGGGEEIESFSCFDRYVGDRR